MWNRFFKTLDVRSALFAFGVCGVVGVLVDIDHLIAYFLLLPREDWRFLHTPLLIVSCIMLCGLSAYCGRLYCKHILKDK
jgi:hypothetical protein